MSSPKPIFGKLEANSERLSERFPVMQVQICNWLRCTPLRLCKLGVLHGKLTAGVARLKAIESQISQFTVIIFSTHSNRIIFGDYQFMNFKSATNEPTSVPLASSYREYGMDMWLLRRRPVTIQ